MKVIADVLEERRRQDDKFGLQNWGVADWILILSEEVGEAAREANEMHFEKKNKVIKYRAEMVQVAAVAIAAIEALDRGYR